MHAFLVQHYYFCAVLVYSNCARCYRSM